MRLPPPFADRCGLFSKIGHLFILPTLLDRGFDRKTSLLGEQLLSSARTNEILCGLRSCIKEIGNSLS